MPTGQFDSLAGHAARHDALDIAVASPATVSATAPDSPAEGALWLDTSISPPALKAWVSGPPALWQSVAGDVTIPDAQVVSALSNSFALKHDPLLYSPTGGYFDIVAPQNIASASAHSRAFRGDSGGKWYFEIAVAGTVVSGGTAIGVAQPSTGAEAIQTGASGTGATQSWSILGDGRKYSGSATSYGVSYAAGDVIMVAVDMSLAVGSRKIWWGKNGTWMASGDPVAGTGEAFANLPTRVCPAVTPSTAILTLRLRSAECSYSPPSGYSAWVS